jgi:hypothetical protein
MTFLAPGWIALAAGAAMAVVAIHLIAWRLPRAVTLPTARFVPDEPARLASRTLRPSDLALLALRVAIIMGAGLALAKPRLGVSPGGVATVIAIERVAIGDTSAVRDSLRAIPGADRVSYVVFDTSARVFTDEATAWTELSREAAPSGSSLTLGLMSAIREARRLESDYESVRIMLLSSFSRSAFDQATEAVRATWPDSIGVMRLSAKARMPEPARVEVSASDDDPVIAGIRLAESNGFLRGTSRVSRGPATAADLAWASNGGVLAVWPQREGTGSIDGVHATNATAIGHFIGSTVPDSGRVIARWADGRPAANEVPSGSGCVRTIAFDVPDVGDFAVTLPFQRVIADLLAPCGGKQADGMVADSVVAGLVAPPATRRAAALPDESRGPNRVAAALMTLAILLAIAELALRRGRRPVAVERAA